MARSWRSGRRAAVLCLLLACGWAGLARADYVVQVGVFEKPRYAGEIARALHLAGLAVRAQAIISVPDGLMIRLLVGPCANRRAAEAAPGPSGSVSAEDLFGLKEIAAPVTPQWTGFNQGTLAYTWPAPAHLSNFRHLFELSTEGRWGTRGKWKASGRLDYDAVFDLYVFFLWCVVVVLFFVACVCVSF